MDFNYNSITYRKNVTLLLYNNVIQLLNLLLRSI